MRGLAESFFSINAIQKESRTINVSFSVDRPDENVTCGNRHLVMEQWGTRKEQSYDPATSGVLWWPAGSRSINAEAPNGLIRAPLVHEIRRRMSLEGRINIYIAPERDGTLMTVNARYILRNNPHGNAVVLGRAGTELRRESLSVEPYSISFDTALPGEHSESSPPIVCRSRGALERRILDLAPPQ